MEKKNQRKTSSKVFNDKDFSGDGFSGKKTEVYDC